MSEGCSYSSGSEETWQSLLNRPIPRIEKEIVPCGARILWWSIGQRHSA